VTATNANNAIDRLVEDGILVPESDRRRDRVWIAPEVLGALDAFAERIGRRRRPG
jgi:hypothetical protein